MKDFEGSGSAAQTCSLCPIHDNQVWTHVTGCYPWHKRLASYGTNFRLGCWREVPNCAVLNFLSLAAYKTVLDRELQHAVGYTASMSSHSSNYMSMGESGSNLGQILAIENEMKWSGCSEATVACSL